MATGIRVRYEGSSGTLGASLTSGATSINLGADPGWATLATGEYIALALGDDPSTVDEIVHVTAYTATASTATIVRGQEGTTGVAHNSADSWRVAPTTLDVELSWIPFALDDGTTTITTGTGKVTTRLPREFQILEVEAVLGTASTSGAVTVDVNESGTSIFSTVITIDQDEEHTGTAATPAVISAGTIERWNELTFDVDGAGTGATGLVVWLGGRWVG